MKKLLKSKIFWIVGGVVIVAAAFMIRSAQQGKQVEYTTEPVKRGEIMQTVSATGQVKSASEIELNFRNTGKLSVLNIETGDKVETGQILAQLKATDLAINVNKARADLDEAQANLDKLKAGSIEQDIAVYEVLVAKSEADLSEAQDSLVNTEATYKQTQENEKKNILVDVDSSLTKANIALQEVYDTLNYEGDDDNFVTSSFSLRQKVQTEYSSSLTKVDEAELVYNLTKIDPTDENIDSAVDLTLVALSQTQDTLDDLSKLLDYVVINSVLTRSELDTLKTTINSERTTIDASISTVQTGKQDLADARLNYQTKVKAAENAVEVARQSLSKAQADLEFKKAPARPEDIALYEARVKKALSDLQYAQDKYEETILKAPIDGVITEVNFEIGEQTSLSEPVIKMLATENYEIKVDIPESDIVKIDLGDKADITLDAFSDDDVFGGTVTTINPAQTEIQDVIYYQVTVTLVSEQPSNVSSLLEKIKPGMTANITIATDKKEDILVIPSRAVKERNGNKIVEVLENGQPREVEVIVGLRGDEGLIEVISGLAEGQSVITFTKGE